jgi:hypothetical protein
MGCFGGRGGGLPLNLGLGLRGLKHRDGYVRFRLHKYLGIFIFQTLLPSGLASIKVRSPIIL